MRFIPAILFAALIFWVSAQPKLPQAPFLFEGIDKLFHAGEYGLLMALLLFGDRWPVGPRAWWWVVPCVVYAMTDEVHQLYVPGRSADVVDVLADASGALAVTAGWLKLALVRRTRQAGATS